MASSTFVKNQKTWSQVEIPVAQTILAKHLFKRVGSRLDGEIQNKIVAFEWETSKGKKPIAMLPDVKIRTTDTPGKFAEWNTLFQENLESARHGTATTQTKTVAKVIHGDTRFGKRIHEEGKTPVLQNVEFTLHEPQVTITHMRRVNSSGEQTSTFINIYFGEVDVTPELSEKTIRLIQVMELEK